MTRRAYIVHFKWGSPAIESVSILKETDKTYTLEKIEDVYGRPIGWYGTRTLKDNATLFETLPEAVTYLMSRIEEHLGQLEKQQSAHTKELQELKELLDSDALPLDRRERSVL